MTHRSMLTMFLGAASLVLSACGGDTGGVAAKGPKATVPAAPVAVARSTRRGPAAAAPAQAEVKTQVLTVPEGYRYDPRGRRDPFVNPNPTKTPTLTQIKPVIVRPDGMRGMLVGETRVTGIIAARDPGMTRAIITSGKHTYFAVPGDALFDGIIREIRPDGVVFTMISPETKQPINQEAVVRTGNSGATSTGDKK